MPEVLMVGHVLIVLSVCQNGDCINQIITAEILNCKLEAIVKALYKTCDLPKFNVPIQK